MAKRRCTVCKGYFPAEEMVSVGMSSVCGEDCRRALGQRVRQSRRRSQSRADEVPTAVRSAVLRRDGYRCRWCGTPRRLQVHHIHYRSELGSHEVSNLITLCNTHHGEAHSNKRRWQPVLKSLVRPESGGLTVLELERIGET